MEDQAQVGPRHRTRIIVLAACVAMLGVAVALVWFVFLPSRGDPFSGTWQCIDPAKADIKLGISRKGDDYKVVAVEGESGLAIPARRDGYTLVLTDPEKRDSDIRVEYQRGSGHLLWVGWQTLEFERANEPSRPPVTVSPSPVLTQSGMPIRRPSDALGAPE